jgi:hypothetical protein
MSDDPCSLILMAPPHALRSSGDGVALAASATARSSTDQVSGNCAPSAATPADVGILVARLFPAISTNVDARSERVTEIIPRANVQIIGRCGKICPTSSAGEPGRRLYTEGARLRTVGDSRSPSACAASTSIGQHRVSYDRTRLFAGRLYLRQRVVKDPI